jgi:catechol 2,3-dioxygenase-like lactoylglutathione lyase family enzyme
MIFGAHVIFYSADADADRAFLRDTIGLKGVDIGHGWLIFALPPAEAAVHPAEGAPRHELYLMCDDLPAEIARLQAAGVPCSKVDEERWGSITTLTLPSGASLGLYQPNHALAIER